MTETIGRITFATISARADFGVTSVNYAFADLLCSRGIHMSNWLQSLHDDVLVCGTTIHDDNSRSNGVSARCACSPGAATDQENRSRYDRDSIIEIATALA